MKYKSPDGNKLAIVNPDAAGIDIADKEMQACVPEDRDGENNRCFGSFTCDLNIILSGFVPVASQQLQWKRQESIISSSSSSCRTQA